MLNSSGTRACRNASQTRYDLVRSTKISECGKRSHFFAEKIRSTEREDPLHRD
jgi:hypothetical protein